ncbi:adhesion G protein-coupled receptor L3-like [Biomphalaria glabrata]|uniref:Adhesion G protein-coupled receptor L3-like n=1 Tax=Biomphalaria glabrata TaxID=6526 RepID=A0A9W3AGN5_BIOGL|nr:adhesion G protein-coupled receptor L3-like [Biomphalaria glabrata]
MYYFFFPASETTEAYIGKTEIPSEKIGACLAAQEYGVSFPETIAGGLSTVACSPRYTGTVNRLCNKGGNWEYPSFRDCLPISLQQLLPLLSRLAELKNESDYRAQEAISNVTESVFEYFRSNPRILSGDIKAIIEILFEMTIALKGHKLIATKQLVEGQIDQIDKILSVDAKEWRDLSKGVKSNNTSDQLLLSLEYLLQTFIISENNTDVTFSKDYLDVTTKTQRNNPLIYPQANNGSFEDTDNEIIFYHSEHEIYRYSIIVYKHIAGKLAVKMFVDNRVDRALRPEPTDKLFNSDIISFSVVPNTKPETLASRPVQITFKIYNTSTPKQICAYLWENNNESYWATHGCETETREDNVTCRCSHLTNFAVLMSPFEPDVTHTSVLQFISAVGIAISLICLVVTITIYVIMWRYIKSDAIILHLNLSVSLFLGYIIFLLGVTRTHNSVTCAVVAVLLHYIFLVVFFVMLAQGLLVLKSVISLSSSSIVKYLFPLMYGVPLIIVIVSVSVTGADGYGNAKMCWLDNSQGLLWAFAAPVCTVLLANFIVLIVVLRTMQTSHALMTKELNIKIKSIIRSVCILSPILGITWAFGVLAISLDQVAFQYLFAISNSLQGLSIFLCQCILQHQVFDGLRAIIRRHRAARLDSTSKLTNTSMQDKVFSDSTLQRTTNSTETETLSKETVTCDEKSL